jgi:hypothetical protein
MIDLSYFITLKITAKDQSNLINLFKSVGFTMTMNIEKDIMHQFKFIKHSDEGLETITPCKLMIVNDLS